MDAKAEGLAYLGVSTGAYTPQYAARVKYGMAKLREAERELPRELEQLFMWALSAYYEHEAWKPNLPRPGGLNQQPYGWRCAIECIRAARSRHEYEEKVKQARIRDAYGDEE